MFRSIPSTKTLIELAWADGFRTGLGVGVVVGIFLVVGLFLTMRRGN